MSKALSIISFLMFSISPNKTTGQLVNISLLQKKDYLITTKEIAFIKVDTLFSIDSILQAQIQKKFRLPDSKPVFFPGYDPYFYWFRIVLQNPTPLPQHCVIAMAPLGMREGKLYQKETGKWKITEKTGFGYPFKTRAIQSSHYAFPFVAQAKTIDTLYLSVDASHAYKTFGFVVMKQQSFQESFNRIYISLGLVIGILLLFCIINLYLFLILKEKIHLWYALYIAFLFFVVIKNDQLDQEFFGWTSETYYRLTPIMAVGAVAISLLMHVIQQFLTTLKNNQFLFFLSNAAKLNAFLSGIIHFLVFNIKPDPHIESLIFEWANKSTILTILIILIDCFYSVIHGFKGAYFILAGLSIFLAGALQRLLLLGNTSYFFPPSLFHLGMIMETLIISLGLIYQYRVDRKEKFLYLQEKEALRNRFEKSLLESKTEIQEQTFKDISQEIHDNIGQILTIVKLNLVMLKVPKSEQIGERISDATNLLGKAIHDLRDLSKKLNPDYILEEGLIKSVEIEIMQIKKTGNYEINFIQTGKQFKLPSNKELILFRIFQETLNNIIKHAQAKSINISVHYEQSFLELRIIDDGIGFNNDPNTGLGIKNMKTRAALINGNFEINSTALGTTVVVKVFSDNSSLYEPNPYQTIKYAKSTF